MNLNENSLGVFPIRIGSAYDIHTLESRSPLGSGKPLLIGGFEINSELGPVGKTDADVLLHATTDAILGALASPTMGELFVTGDRRYKSTDSRVYLTEALTRMGESGWGIGNLDSTVILELPRISPKKEKIRLCLAGLLSCSIDKINVKVKTHEGVDATGRNEAIEAYVSVLLYQLDLLNKINTST